MSSTSIIRHSKLDLPQIFEWKIDINTTFLVLHGLSYLFTRYLINILSKSNYLDNSTR